MGPKMGQEEVKREIGRIWSKSAIGGLEALVHPNYCVIRNCGECTFSDARAIFVSRILGPRLLGKNDFASEQMIGKKK